MRRLSAVLFLVLICAITAAAGKKDSGTTTLKNLDPAGTPGTQGKKNKKTKQQFDFSFEASGKTYTCRTNEKTSRNATDFVVGSNVNYEIDGDKGKLERLPEKKSSVLSYASRIFHPPRNRLTSPQAKTNLLFQVAKLDDFANYGSMSVIDSMTMSAPTPE